MTEENVLAAFNGMVREAYDAQEAFDMWDNGCTFGDAFGKRREVDLDTVCNEWEAANAKLVDFVLNHSAALAQAIEAQRAATGNTDAVADESAVPEGNAP